MGHRILVAALVLILLLGFLFVSGAGCQEQGTEASAEELDSELNELEDLSKEMGNLDMSELDESELESLEGII